MREGVCRLYASIVSFYIMGLNTLGLGYLGEDSWNQSPKDSQRLLYLNILETLYVKTRKL
jgi:hypothetical protein